MNTFQKWSIFTGVSLLTIASLFLYFRSKKKLIPKKRIKNSSVNIGAIFGMDVGGTLTKIVYYERNLNDNHTNDILDKQDLYTTTIYPSHTSDTKNTNVPMPSLVRRISSDNLSQLESPDHREALVKLYNYMDLTRTNGNTTITRDDMLTIYSDFLKGKIHFLHFETKNLASAISYISSASNAPIEHIKTIGCTGGGAHKYAKEFYDQLEITFNKLDELSSLTRGMYFALSSFSDECYTYRSVDPALESNDLGPKRWLKDVKEYTVKVNIPTSTNSFPYLVVNVGSGVSILKVSSPGKFERVSGTSLGGGTYWGLCRLLTKCATYEEVLDLAESGDAGVVDMLVRDIYGKDYDFMNLSGSMVASSFGRLVMKENPREGVKEEDLALALLMMITNNIGQVAHLNAQLHQCNKIYFVGSFLRHNSISCRRLAYAIDFWSRGTMEAFFLRHEGYFGALGAFLMSAFGDELDKLLSEFTFGNEPEINISQEVANTAVPNRSTSEGGRVESPNRRMNIRSFFTDSYKNLSSQNENEKQNGSSHSNGKEKIKSTSSNMRVRTASTGSIFVTASPRTKK